MLHHLRVRRQRVSFRPACEILEGRNLPSGCGCSGGLFAAGGPGESAVVPRIVNGTPTSGFASVGKIGDRLGGFCTGTLIGSRFVLTAGHCSEGVGNTQGRFFLGGQTYTTVHIYVHPSYNPNRLGENAANDIAIWELSRDVIGVTPSPINRVAPQVGQILTLVGFGAGGTAQGGHNGDYGTKRVGTTPIDGVMSRVITWDYDRASESNTAPGDSGGPAFLHRDGVYYVAGVTSGGDKANAGLGDHSFDTRVDAYQSWIDSIVGSSSPTPTPTPDDDHADTLVAATVLTPNADGSGRVSATVDVAGDRDFFRFVAVRTGPLVIRLSNAAGSDLDPVLALFNGSGRKIAVNDDFSGFNSQLRWQVYAGRTYYLRASGYGDSTGEYDLTFAYPAAGKSARNLTRRAAGSNARTEGAFHPSAELVDLVFSDPLWRSQAGSQVFRRGGSRR